MSWPPDFSSDGLVTRGDARSWAVFSADDRYRYLLGRTWDRYEDPEETTRAVCIWIMLNPSTADHTVDDPTIKKCTKYARTWGMGGILVANLFAWRATDPSELAKAVDPIGPANDSILYRVTRNPLLAIVVGGWGNKLPRAYRRRGQQLHIGRSLHCVAVNTDGSPRHPLYVRDDAPYVRIADAIEAKKQAASDAARARRTAASIGKSEAT